MADKPGRRWRESELTGKRKAIRVLEALQQYSGIEEEVAIDRVLSEKLDLKTTAEREPYRKAYYRWADKVRSEWGQEASRRLHEELSEEDQRQPLGPKPAGMVWRDGFWQDIEPAIPPNDPKAKELDEIRRGSGQYPRKK